MKLNPDELVVASFEPAPAPDEEALVAITTPVCPTPNTQCFVCPAPSSPEDGC
jgi:hypothetical protein